MLTVPLTQSESAIIDDCDRDLLRFKWRFNRTNRHKGYAARNVQRNYKRRLIYLHKVIAERKGLAGEIDHRDGNPLNNRRRNLRACTHRQNIQNSTLRWNSRSGLKGVSEHKDRRRYQAWITVDGKLKSLGIWKSKREAARRYNKAAIEHFGEFGALNPV